MMKKNTNPDYLNEQYFEDWGAGDQLSDKAHYAEDVTPQKLPPQTEDFDGPENSSCDGDY
jgi:hypothetical protein